MNIEQENTFKDYLQILRRRKYEIIVPMLIMLVLSIIVTISLPPVFRSKATILIEQQHIPSDLVKSTVISFADERIRQIQQKLMTINNVTKIIDKFDLYPKERKIVNVSELALQFKEASLLELINADVTGKGKNTKAVLAFTLSFDYNVPTTAQKVANEMVTLFLDENVKSRTQRAEESTKFLLEEAEKFKLEIQKIENQIAEYKDKYSGSLPELLSTNLSNISRNQSTLDQLQLQEKTLEEKISSLNNQLSITSPILVESGTEATVKVETKASLDAEYKSLLGKYSENHPDVKALKRKIENFKEPSTDEKGTIEINNPAYLQIQSQINLAKVEAKNLAMQKNNLTEQLKKLEANVAQTHQVERGYADLMRDLENQKLKYSDLNQKYLEAKLAQNLEVEQKGEKFTLLEPPRLPLKPEKPNRIKVLLVGFVVSVIGGLIVGFIVEMMDNSIRNANVLAQLVGVEPLAIIPFIQNHEDIEKSRKHQLYFGLLILALFIGTLVAIHNLYMPLDVVFSKISNQMSSKF